ncbi:Syntaxin-like protein psy1 [Zancudomyces culisetae]|uniref:Syntaxin-like protein psy1 n=1 Tax=Zancudomyces culisetae TaxID=1213189 RepID=A0A1R1PK59_ZANCU|nr:Syntaxin-like protein psy1 [Zancudomyces culisetae]OMH81360.1 Syntaxin-like protein psy1 [Zancudomyces culisetae]|eukprot:OMH79865.1 Syntaxin-like protein psy1 [Zancudomyces culisetae]
MIQRLNALHEKVINSINDSSYKDVVAERDALDRKTMKLIEAIKADLKQMNTAANDRNLTKSQKATRLGRQQGLTKGLGDVIQNYQQTKHQMSQRNRQKLKRQYMIANPEATSEEADEAIASDRADNVFAQKIMNSSRVTNARMVLREVEERQKDIARLERTIVELSEMFNEINMMVEKQQEMIDVVEAAAEETNANTQYAAVEVDKAIVSRRSSRKKLWCLFIFFLIVLIVLGIVLYFQLRK